MLGEFAVSPASVRVHVGEAVGWRWDAAAAPFAALHCSVPQAFLHVLLPLLLVLLLRFRFLRCTGGCKSSYDCAPEGRR